MAKSGMSEADKQALLKLQRANAFAAIREDREDVARNIWWKQQQPRMSFPELQRYLQDLVTRGEIDCTIRPWGSRNRIYYRRRQGQSDLAASTALRYIGPARSESPIGDQVDAFYRALLPLKSGQTVKLWMDDPTSFRKRGAGNTRKLVIVTPGHTIGLPPRVILVSVVNFGSCLVWVNGTKKVANLVLAGVPAKLAQAFIETMNSIFKED